MIWATCRVRWGAGLAGKIRSCSQPLVTFVAFLAQFTWSKLVRFSLEFRLEFIVVILLSIGVVSGEVSKTRTAEI